MSSNTRFICRVAPLFLLDMFLASGCLLAAYFIRLGLPEGGVEQIVDTLGNQPWFQPYISLIIATPFVRVFTYNLFGVYDDRTLELPASDKFVNICKAVSTGSIVLVLVAFAYRGVSEFPGFGYSRLIFAMDWILNLLTVSGAHAIVGAIRKVLIRRGVGIRRIAVQGTGNTALSLMSTLNNSSHSRYRVMGYVANDVPQGSPVSEQGSFEYLGAMNEILDIINDYNLDEIVVTNARTLGSELISLVEDCQQRDVVLKLSLDYSSILTQGGELDLLAGTPVVQINEITIKGFAKLAKRCEDVVLSILLIMLTSPIWLILALLIRYESPGPVLFQQQRVGRNGRTFTMYKLRSMYCDAQEQMAELEKYNEAKGHIFKMRDDPRVTRLGRVLRRTCLDEIPQFLNVLRGEMSIVGPRPPIPAEVESYSKNEMLRLNSTPGITGLWQVNRGTRYSFEDVLKWDIYYIENWSLLLDIKIIFKTIWVILSVKGY